MEKKQLQSTKKQNYLRGGGCGSSVLTVEQSIKQVQNQNVFDLFQKFSHYVKIIESKASVAANQQESQEIMIAIQWFVLKEDNIYQLNKHAESVKKSYDLILDGIYRLLKSCLIYIRTDQFKCFYILQITASLSKVIFSYHLINDKRYMKCETQKTFQEICEELKLQIEIEKNDLILNQIELYLQLTQSCFEIAPTNSNEEDKILKQILKSIVASAISMSQNSDFFESLFDGVCLLIKRFQISAKKKQYEVYYQIDMLQWEVINYFKDDKGKTLEEIILLMEKMHETLVKSSQNWNDHYLWIQMIGKILSYNPLITKRNLEKSQYFTEQRSQSEIWKHYKQKGLLIYTNHDNDEAVIVLNQLQNKKTLQLDRLVLENIFKNWESMILLKEFFMNEQSQNIPYTFGAYLKGQQLKLEDKVIENIMKVTLSLNKVKKFLGFIIPNKLINLILQDFEYLGQVDKISRSFGIDKQINFQISQDIYAQKMKKIICNLEQHFKNSQNILKLLRLNLINYDKFESFQNSELTDFLQFKYQLKLFNQNLQEQIENRKNSKINQYSNRQNKREEEKNKILQDLKISLRNIQQSFEQPKNLPLPFVSHLLEVLNTFPPTKSENLIQESQRIITLIQDSQKQIQTYEISLLKNGDLIKNFQELIKGLYKYYAQVNQEFEQNQNHLILSMQEIFIQKQQIEAVSQFTDLENIKQNFYKIKLIDHVETSRSSLQQLKLKLVTFKEAFQILLKHIQSEEKIQKLEVDLQQIFLDKIQNYPQIIISCNNNWEYINFNNIQKFCEVDEVKIKNQLQKQIGIIKFLIFKLNLEQQVINSETQDLELIHKDKEVRELFAEKNGNSCMLIRRIWLLLEKVPIDKSIDHLSENFDESQLKKETEIYENLLIQLQQIKVPQVDQITELIKSTQILVEAFQNSVKCNLQILLIPLGEGLKTFKMKREKFKEEYQEYLEKQDRKNEASEKNSQMGRKEQYEEAPVFQNWELNSFKNNNTHFNSNNDDINNLQNFNRQEIKHEKINHTEKQFTNLQFLINVFRFKNAQKSELKQLLEQYFVSVEQFFNISDYFLQQTPDIQREMLKAFNSIILNLRQKFELLLRIQVYLQLSKYENFHQYFERLINFSSFSELINNKTMELNKNVQEYCTQQQANLQDFISRQKIETQRKLDKIYHQTNEIFIEQEFLIQQLQIIFLQDNEDEKLDEDQKEDFGFFENYIQENKDFKSNDDWKIKQGLIFVIIQISSNCFTNSIMQFCQDTLIQLWVEEKDQLVRSLLKNQDLISIQMQILHRDWKNQHDRIKSKLKSMLKKIDDLQEQVSHEVNPNQREQLFKELDETTQQLEEYISRISEMGQQLRLITDFVNYMRKELQKVKIKINQMKEQLTNGANDVKFLRGKSVEQLFEIRKWKVLKIAAQKNVKSIYVPLKTFEKKKEKVESETYLVNFEQFNDKKGEVNKFLLDGTKTVLLIHGTAGSGKSTIAKKIEEFIWKLHGQNKTNQTLIPVYISLPSLENPVYQAVEETLHQDEYGFDELQLKECKEMLEQRKFRFLLIMDSYDEMKLENIQKNLYISNKLLQNWSNPLVIFTTRNEIFSSNNYTEWFAHDYDKNNLKEIELQKFDKDQKLEYLKKYTSLSIKILIFETFEWQIQIQNQVQIDLTRFEMTWELLEAQVLKQQLENNLKFDLLLNEKQIKNIISFLKNNEFIALESIEAIRSLDLNLCKLWSVQKYMNIMEVMNLDKLIETPYMMEIVVQALPLIVGKAYGIENLKQNFIKNFSKMMLDALKSFYTIKMYEQQKFQLNQQKEVIENQIVLNDIHSLEEIDYNFSTLQVWKQMEGNQTIAKFKVNQEFDELKVELKNIFLKTNISNLYLQARIVQKLQFQNETIIDLIYDALKEQNLTNFDFYAEFIMQHHLKQIQKLQKLGKSINSDQILHDLEKQSTLLAQKIQYQQKGLLFKEQNLEDEWLNKFFNDNDLGSNKKDIRSCTLIQQKGSNFQFVHKSIQEFLIAQDLFALLEWSININSQVFSQIIDILSKKEKTKDCVEFLTSEVIKTFYETKFKFKNQNLFEQQKQLNNFLNNINKVINFIKTIKNHDFNLFNYSTDIYAEIRRFFINKVQKEQKINKCLKFLVDLTRFEDSFIQSGSNAINLLVEMKADLQQQSFQNIKIQNTSLEGANFTKCDFSYSQFDNVNINGVNLNGALLINCNWQKLRIDELHQFLGHGDCVHSVCFSPDGMTLASGSWDKSICLWDVKTGAMKQQLGGHGDSVYSVCFSPDGATLASGSDDKSIRLWDVKTGIMVQWLDGHGESVYSVCFSPDGATLASGSWDKSIRLWDAKTGAMEKQLDGHVDCVHSVCFSPDGMTLASGSWDKLICLWNVKTGTMNQRLDGHGDSVYSVCFSPDGATLASGSWDKSICLWDMKTGTMKQQLNGHGKEVSSVSFSSDGATLASGSRDKSIRLWDVNKKTMKQQLNGHGDSVFSVCFSPDGATLASCSKDKSICLWDVKTGTKKQQLNGHGDRVYSVCFSPDGATLASCSEDISIRLWDVKTGTKKQQLNGHGDRVYSVCFSPDGATLASGSEDKSIRLWDVKTGTMKQQLDGHGDSVYSVSFSSDGATLASGSEDKSIRIWDLKLGKMKQQLDGHDQCVSSVFFSPDGAQLASGSWDKSIRLWDVKAGKMKQQLDGHDQGVSSVFFSPDGAQLASGSWDKSIRLWDVKVGKTKQQLDGHDQGVSSVFFSPDGATLASGSWNRSIYLWDVKTGKMICQLDGHDDWVSSVCFSSDGATLATGSEDKSIRIWDLKLGKMKQQLDGHDQGVSSVFFSPDGATLASGSWNRSIYLWDVKTGKMIYQLDGHDDSVYSVCFSPDGATLASGSEDKSIRLWDVKTGTKKQPLNGHGDSVYSVCFSPDGATLASGSEDKSICLWDVKTGKMVQRLDGHGESVYSVCFSSDGATLASGSRDKSIRLWDVKTGKMKQQQEGHGKQVSSVCFSPNGAQLKSGIDDKICQLWQIQKDSNFYECGNQNTLQFNFNSSKNNLQSTTFSTIVFISPYYQFQSHKTLIFFGTFQNHLGMDLRQLFQQKGCIMIDKFR